MEFRYTIRILNMPSNDAQMAEILRRQGMSVYDNLHAIPPSTLTYRDDINGAGARTFIWNDRAYPTPVQTRELRVRESQDVQVAPSFEEDNTSIDSHPLARLQDMYEVGAISLAELRGAAQQAISEADRILGDGVHPRVGAARNMNSTVSTTRSNSSVRWNAPPAGFGFDDNYGNYTEPSQSHQEIKVHEKQHRRIIRLDD